MKAPLNVPEVFPEVELIQDSRLREQVIAVWQELWQASEWEDIHALPVSGNIPYPHVVHNRAVVALALAVADVYERFHGRPLDRDVLIAAALLQDASKLVEYRPKEGGGVEHTDIGRNYPHAFWAAHVAVQRGLPDAVCHILWSHTPNAPEFPRSLEGKILYYVDQLDVLGFHDDRWRKRLYIYR